MGNSDEPGARCVCQIHCEMLRQKMLEGVAITFTVVGVGWSSPEVATSSWDGLWEAFTFKARNPQKFKMIHSEAADNLAGLGSRLPWTGLFCVIKLPELPCGAHEGQQNSSSLCMWAAAICEWVRSDGSNRMEKTHGPGSE